MRYVKGQSGNPGGRPKVTGEVVALCKKYTPEAIETLAGIMRDEQAHAGARVSAALGILKKTLPDLAAIEHSGEVIHSFEDWVAHMNEKADAYDARRASGETINPLPPLTVPVVAR